MVIGHLSIELHIPGARSLKEKRMVLRSVKDRIKKFNVAVAEVEYNDLWQRAGLSVVTVSNDEKHADRELAAVVTEIERVEPGLSSRTEVEFLAEESDSGTGIASEQGRRPDSRGSRGHDRPRSAGSRGGVRDDYASR